MKNIVDFEQKIRHFVETYDIDKIIIGYSGGADSQFLLHCVKNIDIQKQAIHINHGISDHANDWEIFCEEQCAKLNIPFLAYHFNFKTVKNNVEKQAREKRYACFHEHADDSTLLLTGHHLDDQAETVLMRLFRGSGLDGMEGIPEHSVQDNLTIYRPLLDIDKETIKHQLCEEKISWIEDESNAESEYDRNFIRNQIIPMIKKRWSSANHNIAEFSNICKTENRHIKEKTELNLIKALKNGKLCIKTLKTFQSHEIEKVIRLFFKKNDSMAPSKKQMQSILKQIVFSNSNGKVLFKNFSIQRYNNHLYFVNRQQKSPEFYTNFDFEVKFLEDIDKNTTIFYNNMNKKVYKLIQEQKIEPWLRKTLPIAVLDNKVIGIGNIIKSDDCPYDINLFNLNEK